MANTRNEMAEMATARANVYGLLANVFREEPSNALLSQLMAPEFSGAMNALGLSLDDMFNNKPRDQLLEDLSIEYSRLFFGPGHHISPHESLHVKARFGEENEFWGASTVAVKKFMEGAGLQVAESFIGMPDHISAEFEFMQRLLEIEADAWNDGDKDLGANIQNIENRFFDEHLSQWVNQFCDKVIDATDNLFYRQFAEVTKHFIEFEAKTLVNLADTLLDGEKVSA